MSDFNYVDALKKLPPEKLKAIAALAKDRRKQIQKEPLVKHKFNNEGQRKIRSCKKRYRVINAGNKTGKTDELGFELAAICKGKAEEFGINFPHKPPLKIWYCGRDRNVLSDEPLSSIKRYLRGEGEDHRTVWTGQAIQRMYIDDDQGNTSEIWFKPYNGEIGIFESANVHAVFMDEEPPRDVFSAIKTKLAIMPGYCWVAMTADKGMSWTWDLLNGTDPDHGSLYKQGMLEAVEASVFDNIKNFKISQGRKWLRFPEEWIERITNEEYRYNNKGECEIYAPDTFADYINQFAFGSNEYRMRILGHYVSFTGKVYVYNQVKNTFDLSELPPYSQLKFFGALDWGYNDEFCYFLAGIDSDNNIWIIDGIYESYLDAKDQARKVKEISDFWGIVPEMIVADNQIENRLAQKDATKPHIESIKDYYMDELGEHWTTWRTEELDKRDPHIKRDAVNRALKSGKLKISNFQNRLYQHQSEIMKLEFSAGNKDKLKGKDHFDATLRMFFGANIDFDGWITSQQAKQQASVHRNYRRKSEPLY